MHWVANTEILPYTTAECYNCVTVEEYAEQRGISLEKAHLICDILGEEEGDEDMRIK